MSRRVRLVLGGLGITLLAILPMLAQQGAKSGEWRAFGAEEGSTAYSSLDLINRDNIKDLKVACPDSEAEPTGGALLRIRRQGSFT